METFIIRITKPAKAVESISKILVATKSIKPMMQKIYLRSMRGAVAVCLS